MLRRTIDLRWTDSAGIARAPSGGERSFPRASRHLVVDEVPRAREITAGLAVDVADADSHQRSATQRDDRQENHDPFPHTCLLLLYGAGSDLRRRSV